MPLIQDSNLDVIYGAANFAAMDTKLDAINLCMRAIGREGVDSEGSGDLDAEDASKMIDIVSQRIQSNRGGGWWFNREPNWNLSPDTNGEVNLPNNTLSVLQCYGFNDRKVPMTARAGKLYSTWNHSFDLRNHVNADGRLRLTIVVLLPFEHLPANVRMWVAYASAAEFISAKDGDKTQLQIIMQQATQLSSEIQSEETSQLRLNMMVHNPTQRAFGVMAGGYQNNGGFEYGPYSSGALRPWRPE